MSPALRSPSIVRVVLLLSLSSALAASPNPAAAQGRPAPGPNQAFLYEMSENAVLQNAAGHDLVPDPVNCPFTQLVDPQTGQCAIPVRRVATSELQGVAAAGTPLCPAVLITNPKSDTCTVTATGRSDISLTPDPPGDLVGSLSGSYAVVIQLDNRIDSPEWPQQTGTFSGTIHFRTSAPLGFTDGAMLTIDGMPGSSFPFAATFRQPFAMSARGERLRPRRGQDAFYLGDNGHPISVRQDERAVGWPAVRFEVNF